MQGVADLADGEVRGVEQGLGLDEDALADDAAWAFAGGGLDLAGEGGGGYLQEAPDHIPSEPLLSEPVYPLYGPVQPDIVAHGLLFQMYRYWKSPVLDERGHLRRGALQVFDIMPVSEGHCYDFQIGRAHHGFNYRT